MLKCEPGTLLFSRVRGTPQLDRFAKFGELASSDISFHVQNLM